MPNLSEILGYIENGLDPEHIKNTGNRLKNALNYVDDENIVIKTDLPCDTFQAYPFEKAFCDMEKMMVNELIKTCGGSCCNCVDIRDDSLPMIRGNYNVGIIPSIFGLKTRFVGERPWTDHVASIDDIKRIIEKGVPAEIKTGLAGKVFETQEYYREMLQPYPVCRDNIEIYHADIQGPFDVAHLIWGPDIYYALYDKPEIVHALLDLVTETIIAFMKESDKTVSKADEGFVFQWGTLYRGNIVIRDDTSVNLSKEMFREFVQPYDERIFQARGGGSVHYCGRADQWVYEILETVGLLALNNGQPPNISFGFDFLEKIYDKAKERKIALINYIMDIDDIQKVRNSRFKTGVTYMTQPSDREAALKILHKNGITGC